MKFFPLAVERDPPTIIKANAETSALSIIDFVPRLKNKGISGTIAPIENAIKLLKAAENGDPSASGSSPSSSLAIVSKAISGF